MDIFTDASLNDRKKIAGIGLVFVSTAQSIPVRHSNTYFLTDNIETAELFAISEGIAHVIPRRPKVVRVFSDSKGALRKLQRIFHHPNQKQIDTIDNPTQKEILLSISTSFKMMMDVNFSFYHIHGHQHKSPKFSIGYYNMLADQEASSGRLFGEMLLGSANKTSGDYNKSYASPQKNDGIIVSPAHITFYYENLNKGPKLISRYSNHKKENTVRRANQSAQSRGR